MKQTPVGFIEFLVGNSDDFTIEDNCLSIVDSISGEVTPFKIDGKRLSLPVERSMKDEITFMNPFRESSVSFQGDKQFYNILTCIAIGRIQEIVLHLQEDEHTPAFIKLMGKALVAYNDNASNIDKLISKVVDKRFLDFFQVFYLRQDKTASARSVLIDKDADALKTTYSVPKKAINAAKKLFAVILGSNGGDLSHLVYTTDILSCGKLDSVTRVYGDLFRQLNTFFETFDKSLIIDMDEYDTHVENLERYSKELNWLAPSAKDQVVASAKKAGSASRSANKGRDTSKKVETTPKETLSIGERIRQSKGQSFGTPQTPQGGFSTAPPQSVNSTVVESATRRNPLQSVHDLPETGEEGKTYYAMTDEGYVDPFHYHEDAWYTGNAGVRQRGNPVYQRNTIQEAPRRGFTPPTLGETHVPQDHYGPGFGGGAPRRGFNHQDDFGRRDPREAYRRESHYSPRRRDDYRDDYRRDDYHGSYRREDRFSRNNFRR